MKHLKLTSRLQSASLFEEVGPVGIKPTRLTEIENLHGTSASMAFGTLQQFNQQALNDVQHEFLGYDTAARNSSEPLWLTKVTWSLWIHLSGEQNKLVSGSNGFFVVSANSTPQIVKYNTKKPCLDWSQWEKTFESELVWKGSESLILLTYALEPGGLPKWLKELM